MKRRKKQRGSALVESLLASGVLLFTFSAAFLVVDKVVMTFSLENHKDEMANELDKRVNEYRLTGNFNQYPIDDVVFLKKDITDMEEKKSMQIRGRTEKVADNRMIRFYAIDLVRSVRREITIAENKDNYRNDGKSKKADRWG